MNNTIAQIHDVIGLYLLSNLHEYLNIQIAPFLKNQLPFNANARIHPDFLE